jgi:hypothetical protein
MSIEALAHLPSARASLTSFHRSCTLPTTHSSWRPTEDSTPICLVFELPAGAAVTMAEEDLADAYQMLEELGSTHLFAFSQCALLANRP